MTDRIILSILVTLIGLCSPLLEVLADAADRPNILWITSEDNGPHLGCYGDEYATTPNLDSVAQRRACDTSPVGRTRPVCAPARTCLISGLYPPSTGAEHMRSKTRLELPEGFLMYPQYLREAGYYCTNNSKEDYNLEKPGHRSGTSPRKRLTGRTGLRASRSSRSSITPSATRVRFATTSPSKHRIHDPKEVRIPPTIQTRPEVRKDWAQYYDRLTMMDAQFGETAE